MRPWVSVTLLGLVAVTSLVKSGAIAIADENSKDLERFEQVIQQQSERLRENSDDISALSSRGGAYFHLSKFKESLDDFDRMIELDPRLAASHWRRGITLYYLGEFKEAAKQFESYHSFDNVDRENGIWRFLCQAEAYGIDRAKERLLKYEKTDRKPFPDLYAMFAGTLTPDQVLKRIQQSDVGSQERSKQLFYAHLYVALYLQALDKPTEIVRTHLRKAVSNAWGQKASGGPGYMWQVARVHLKQLSESSEQPQTKQ